jgi:hypothetical protein
MTKEVEQLDLSRYNAIEPFNMADFNLSSSSLFPLQVNIHHMVCSEAKIFVNIKQFTDRKRNQVMDTIKLPLTCLPNIYRKGTVHSIPEEV